jgi:hypothetical protein
MKAFYDNQGQHKYGLRDFQHNNKQQKENALKVTDGIYQKNSMYSGT